MEKIRRIFPGGNTSIGFVSFHDNIISSNRNMLYILKGMPGGGKSSLMNNIGERISEKGYSIEYHHCPSDPESIDGIVIEELKIAIVDGTPPHSIDPVYPGLTDKIVDLSGFINSNILKEYEKDIREAKKNNKYAYGKSFNYLRAAKVIHGEIVESNKRMLDYKGINKETERLMEKIFAKTGNKIIDNGFKERHLFSAALTPEGYVDYTESILGLVSQVYYIDGDIGTGKSTILKKIAEGASMKDYHIEIYHNSLIPEEFESVFIKELDIIVTSNKKGKEFAETKLNLNEYFNNENINEEDYDIFNLLVEKGIKNLKGAKNNHFILEKSYKPAIDYKKVSQVREKIYKEILELEE